MHVYTGAMENWGLVTYRERLLLADDNSPITTKQIVAIVVGKWVSSYVHVFVL